MEVRKGPAGMCAAIVKELIWPKAKVDIATPIDWEISANGRVCGIHQGFFTDRISAYNIQIQICGQIDRAQGTQHIDMRVT